MPSVEDVFEKVGIKPRPGQAEVAEKLSLFIEQGKRILLSAPVGWGKTIAVIASLVRAGALPALWLTRSLALGARVREDAERWGLYTYVAAGRERTCPLARELGDAVHDFCRFHRGECPYARLPPSLPLAVSWEELASRGEREGWCAYFAQDTINADIVVQSYFRRRRPARAVVIDEAHNLALPQERVYTVGDLAEAVAAAREAGASATLVRSLKDILHDVMTAATAEIRCTLRDEHVAELRRIYFERLRSRDARLKVVIDMLGAAAVHVEGEKIYVYKPPLAIWQRPAVLVSATLPSWAADLLRADAELRVPWSVRAKAFIVEGVTTKYEEYSAHVAERYKLLLARVGKRHKRILVFAASERVAKDLRAWATYEETLPPPGWEGVLLLRARGRFSEGVDLQADAIVIAGAPFLPPEVASSLARVLKRAGHPDPVRAAIDAPMIIATLQSIGRAWRDPRRPPIVYLADERFTRYKQQLEEYLDLETVPLDKL